MQLYTGCVQSTPSSFHILGSDDKLSFVKNTCLLHWLAAKDEISKIRRILSNISEQQRHDLMAHTDEEGRTVQQVANTLGINQFLEWTTSQQLTNHYYLSTPVAVLVMYTTVDRPDADDEAYKLQEILSEFKIYASVSADLSKTKCHPQNARFSI